MKRIALIAVFVGSLTMSGCTQFDNLFGTNTASLTPQQKVTLTATILNDACVISASGLSFAGGVNAIVHPNATTGGSGASAASTIQKSSSIDALTCQSLNGVEATIIGTTSAGAATVAVPQ